MLTNGDTMATSSSLAVSSRQSKVFTNNVIQLVLCYGIMALHASCFDQITPVFLSTPVGEGVHDSTSNWYSQLFHVNGGLAYSSATVASFISMAGLLSIALMIFVFPRVDTYFGSLACLRGSILIYPILYISLPYLVLLPTSPGWVRFSSVATIFGLKTLASVFSFNDSAILLNLATPSPEALGFVNGVAQTAANGARALGPAIMGIFMGLGERYNTNVLGWWFLALVGITGVAQAFLINDEDEL